MGSVGAELKKVRSNRGMTIKALAERTGLSVGFISNVERDVNSPTISSLQRLCEALGTDVVSFFRASASTSIVSRRGDCQRLEMAAASHTTCELYPQINRRLQPSYITIGPGGFYGDPPLCHEGEEVCFVASGTVTVTAGENEYQLSAGDCIYIESCVPHQLRNHGPLPVETVWVTLRYPHP